MKAKAMGKRARFNRWADLMERAAMVLAIARDERDEGASAERLRWLGDEAHRLHTEARAFED